MPVVIYGLSFVAGIFSGFVGNTAIHTQLEALPTLGTGVVKIGDKWIFREDVIQYFVWIVVAISGFHHKVIPLGYFGLGGLVGSMVTKVIETQTTRTTDAGTESGGSEANSDFGNFGQESIGREEKPAKDSTSTEKLNPIFAAFLDFFNRLFFKESATTIKGE